MNNNLKYSILALAGIAVFVLAQLAYSSRLNDQTKISGLVTKVSEGGMKDIVVSIKDVRGIHYISKSNTKGLNVDDLNKELVNKKISLTYIRPGILSKLSPVTDTRLITRIELRDSVIYSTSN